MSGATGAGSAAGAAKAAGKSGARGSAADSQGGTVTETRGPKPPYEMFGGDRPGGKQTAQPYRPPQAYPSPQGDEDAEPGARLPRTGARTTPRTRKARLRVAKADPWSVMKVSFLLSIALGICTVIAAAVLWMVMDAMGVFSTVGGTISEATGSTESNGFDLQSFLSLPRVLIFTSVVAVIDVVLATALATLGAFIYNLSAGFVGGVELTLAEDE
ncbi:MULTISPECIES: DUF3566 domain-containing protein [Streptomyces]|uniref:DUF3566 domain-containing protein n=2 Tax=Streptomyces TaxID=1883 RepID=A0A646KAW3_STRJU|nr:MULTISPECIES: DUF3566 domain-containing protein [Streptomyces]MQS38018.1 DUF3566 domain-containing protein [Streptomyces katsurahamanus]MQS99323.1 DUF3566 domain-containing protein [Streptomyces jumonjinensis]